MKHIWKPFLIVLLTVLLTACGKPAALPTEAMLPATPPETGVESEPQPTVPDVAGFTDASDIEPDEFCPGDDAWLPPTDEGLADTFWNYGCWGMDLLRDDRNPDFTGTARLIYREPPSEEFVNVYHGLWRMERSGLYLELSSDTGDQIRGSFPVLIDPSGEHLYITRSTEGTALPLFGEDTMSAELTLSYG